MTLRYHWIQKPTVGKTSRCTLGAPCLTFFMASDSRTSSRMRWCSLPVRGPIRSFVTKDHSITDFDIRRVTGCVITMVIQRKEATLQWCHNERDGVSNHRRIDCLLNRLLRRRSKKTSTLRVTGLCVGNSPVTGEFPAQRASNAENVLIWLRHHEGLQGLGVFATLGELLKWVFVRL